MHSDAPVKKHVAVVGGGVGGLVCAGLLAKDERYQVVLLEKNDTVGGRMQSEYIDGWRFDSGPSLLLFPNIYKETLASLGVDNIEMEQVLPAAYRVFFTDGDSIDLLHDTDDMRAQLELREPGAARGYDKFLEMSKNHLEVGMPYFIERDFTEFSDAKGLFDLIPKASVLNPFYLLGPYDLVLKQFFKSPKIRAAFTFQTLYVGLNPFNSPGVFSLLAGTEIIDGVYYPTGGFEKIRDSLKDAVERLGVEIRTGIEVQAIHVAQGVAGNSLATGITTNSGEHIDADIVVSNRDVAASYQIIDSKTDFLAKYASEKVSQLESYDYSCGIISFQWCLNKKVDALLHHNVFISNNARKAWRPARNAREIEEFPNFYVHMPSKTDSTASPGPDSESLMILLPVANLQQIDESSYDDLIQVGRVSVLRYLEKATGITNFESLIVHEKIIDPPQWRDMYGLTHGAAFGLSHGLNQLSIFRPPIKDAMVSNLYFTGASTRPGNGVPLCMIGARLAAERIIKDSSTNDLP
jgi:phytoene desaturase (3,4-didehydrolycopene-forming)